MTNLPDYLTSVSHLEDVMTQPSQRLIDDLASLDGDITILAWREKWG